MSKHKAVKSATKPDVDPAVNTQVVATKAKSIHKSADQDITLNAKEQELLAECETDINENLQGAFVLGYRLEQIRDQKLYRATHDTFASYCAKKWDFSKTHANRLIQAYLCEKNLKSIKDVEVYVPTKESHVRYICDLEPEQQIKVASKVFEDVGEGEATAAHFEEARQELFPKPKREAKPNKTVENEPSEIVVPVKFDTKLVSLAELKELADDIYYIMANASKKQEALNKMGQLQRGLEEWADWQAVQKTKEAA